MSDGWKSESFLRMGFRLQWEKNEYFPSKSKMNRTVCIYKGPPLQRFVYLISLSMAWSAQLAKVLMRSRSLPAPHICDSVILREPLSHLQASFMWREKPCDPWLKTMLSLVYEYVQVLRQGGVERLEMSQHKSQLNSFESGASFPTIDISSSHMVDTKCLWMKCV